jgi:hypothetical protein
VAGGLELSRYQEQQAARDREFKERHEAAEREKQAALAGFGSSLSKYEEQARRADEEAKRKREEEERRRQEDLKTQSAKLASFRDKQAAEEVEFRRRQEEAERSKQVRILSVTRDLALRDACCLYMIVFIDHMLSIPCHVIMSSFHCNSCARVPISNAVR